MSNQRKVHNFITQNGIEITQSSYPYYSGSLRVKMVEDGYILTGAMKLPLLKENDTEGHKTASARPGLGKNFETKAILSPLGMHEPIKVDLETEGLFQEVRNVVAFYKADLKQVAGVLRILEVNDTDELGNQPALKAEFVYAHTKVKVGIVGFLNEDREGNEYFRIAPQTGTELFSGDRVRKFSRRKASETSGDEPQQIESWAYAKALLDELNNKPAKATVSGDKDIDDMID